MTGMSGMSSMAGAEGLTGVTDGNDPQDEIQILTPKYSESTLAPSNGDFKLSFESETTTSLVFNSTQGDIQSALEALSTIGSGNIQIVGDFISESYTVSATFSGDLAGTNVELIQAFNGDSPLRGVDPASFSPGVTVTAEGADATITGHQIQSMIEDVQPAIIEFHKNNNVTGGTWTTSWGYVWNFDVSAATMKSDLDGGPTAGENNSVTEIENGWRVEYVTNFAGGVPSIDYGNIEGGIQEVWTINLDNANYGTYGLGSGASLAYNATSGTIETYLSTQTGNSWSVSSLVATRATGGTQSDPTFENELQRLVNITIDVAAIQEGG